MNRKTIIAVDFDGTLCKDDWPGIGEPNRVLIEILKRLKEGDRIKLILWTCRSDSMLDEAVKWCGEQGLIFDAVNDNLPEYIELFGNNSRKVFADIYIDDKGFNVEGF